MNRGGASVVLRARLRGPLEAARLSGNTSDYLAARTALLDAGVRSERLAVHGLFGIALQDPATHILVDVARQTLNPEQTPPRLLQVSCALGDLAAVSFQERTSPDGLVAMRAIATDLALINREPAKEVAFPLPVVDLGIRLKPDIDAIRQIPDLLREAYADLAARIH